MHPPFQAHCEGDRTHVSVRRKALPRRAPSPPLPPAPPVAAPPRCPPPSPHTPPLPTCNPRHCFPPSRLKPLPARAAQPPGACGARLAWAGLARSPPPPRPPLPPPSLLLPALAPVARISVPPSPLSRCSPAAASTTTSHFACPGLVTAPAALAAWPGLAWPRLPRAPPPPPTSACGSCSPPPSLPPAFCYRRLSGRRRSNRHCRRHGRPHPLPPPGRRPPSPAAWEPSLPENRHPLLSVAPPPCSRCLAAAAARLPLLPLAVLLSLLTTSCVGGCISLNAC